MRRDQKHSRAGRSHERLISPAVRSGALSGSIPLVVVSIHFAVMLNFQPTLLIGIWIAFALHKRGTMLMRYAYHVTLLTVFTIHGWVGS